MRAKTGENVSKVRVHELAKQLGMESKVVLAKLQEMGEFVRSASSTVEAPVVRKLIELYPDAKPVEEKKPVKKAAAKKAAIKPKEEVSAEQAASLAAELGVDLEALKAEQVRSELHKAEMVAKAEAERAAQSAPEAEKAKPAPRVGNNPFSSGPSVVPRPPRPGNNPFSTGGTTPRPPQRPPGAPRPGMAGARPGSVRPGFAARPPSSRPATGAGFPARTSAGPTTSSPYKSGGPTGAPTTGAPTRPGGGRPPQRGGAGGAFGKNASKKSVRKAKSRKALRD